MIFLNSAVFTFLAVLIGVPVFLGIFRIFGVYMIVQERSCCVYVLVGKVVDVLDQPGLYFLPAKLGLAAFFVNIFGKCYVLDIRLDQEYRRSEPVNSEEGAPMGIGIWYEMWISDPIALSVQEYRPARFAAGKRQQRHRPLPEQHASGGYAPDPPHREPDGSYGSFRPVPVLGPPTPCGSYAPSFLCEVCSRSCVARFSARSFMSSLLPKCKQPVGKL